MLINKCWVNKKSKQIFLETFDFEYYLYEIRTNKKFRFRNYIARRIRHQATFDSLPYLNPDIWKPVKKGRRII